MHINLILGLVVILAIWWLLKNRQERKAANAEPADMLMDEISKRREAQLASTRAINRMRNLREQNMRPVAEGLKKMAAALPKNGPEQIIIEDNGELVRLTLHYAIKKELPDSPERKPDINSEIFEMEWNVKNFDIELFSGSSSLQSVSGEYIIRMKDGTILKETELTGFMRRVSALIADRLA